MKENKCIHCFARRKLKPIVPVRKKIAPDIDIPKTFKLITDFVTGEKIPEYCEKLLAQTNIFCIFNVMGRSYISSLETTRFGTHGSL